MLNHDFLRKSALIPPRANNGNYKFYGIYWMLLTDMRYKVRVLEFFRINRVNDLTFLGTISGLLDLTISIYWLLLL